MGIMDKFATVEIKADKRISDADKAFCLRQQAAFDKAGPALQKIVDTMIAAQTEQKEALEANEDDFYKTYLVCDGFNCDEDYVFEAMKKRNKTFISAIVNYFSHTYNVKLDEREIMEHLIPAGPKEPKLPWGGYRQMSGEEISAYKEELDAYNDAKEKYEHSMRVLPLRYEQIVDEIFVQLGGFSFEEQSMNEFLERTWNACHRTYSDQGEKFEIKNATLRLDSGIICDENKWMTNPVPEYKPTDDLITLLDALAWYQCGRMNEGHLWFPELGKTWKGTKERVTYTRNMSKVERITLFKNGRVDIKFRSAAYVQEFAEQCLRRGPIKSAN